MVLCIITVSLTTDVLSLVAIYYKDVLPKLLVDFICKTYVITLVWGCWSALVYVITDMVSEHEHRRIRNRLLLIGSAESLFVYLLPIYIFDDGEKVFTYGPAVMAVYVLVALDIIATLTIAWILRKRINPRRRFAITLWMLIWIASAVIQFFNDGLLIVGFASALGLLILFVIMENPEANLDHRLGCFNAYALTEYLKQCCEQKKELSVLEIFFENDDFSDGHRVDPDELMRRILHILERKSSIFSFKNINMSLVLTCEDAETLARTGQTILDTFSDVEIFQKSATVILADRISSFDSYEEVFRFFSFVRTSYSEERGKMIYITDQMIHKFKEKDILEKEITHALMEDRVEVFLQPIFSNNDGGFTSAEALVRIRKQDGTMLPPGQFIPLAEENGQILQLGERIFEKVCQFLKSIDTHKCGIHYVEINLSVVQCEKLDLAEQLISIVEKYQIDPGLINLEITETASISARKILLENMKKLIDYGFSFSLDDFGKGESNLMYVVEMPVSIVKLDMDMSKAFFQIPKARQVVRAVISMAHGMGLKVVAEGIETNEETYIMSQEGIDYIQGYYYSRPLPMEAFLEFITNSRRNYV
ncbi:MAG: EAL domain-containing protein [Firmicutes bacterium]|nr:EAL domain-containing protein [Bacillota bacterium]